MVDMRRDGFSLVEVIIAMLILSVGILSMGASTGFVLNQVRSSELRGERMAAIHQAAEVLGGTAWGSLSNVCSSQTFQTERYEVSCQVTTTGNLSRVTLTSVGPGYAPGGFHHELTETFEMSFAEPVQ